MGLEPMQAICTHQRFSCDRGGLPVIVDNSCLTSRMGHLFEQRAGEGVCQTPNILLSGRFRS